MGKCCALVNLGSRRVENLIVADASTDTVGEGYLLVANPPAFVVIGTAWDGTNFVADGVTAPAQVDGLETL